MQDYISQLPAPLPLCILLELPDLKALYAAILSSLHLYATFRLNAHHIFSTVARRAMADEINTAIQIHIYLHKYLHEESAQDLRQTLQGGLRTALQNHTGYSSSKSSAETIFRVLAQTIRLHDIGVCILKSKLEYLTTLQLQKLADPEFRYRREIVTSQHPQGTTLAIPTSLRGPSWTEENRILWALWILSIARLASCRLANYSYHTALVDITRTLLDIASDHFNWTENVMSEVRRCLSSGPSLRPPTSTPNILYLFPCYRMRSI
jgi:hypothetical protein